MCSEMLIISKCVYGSYSPFVKNVLDRSISYIHPYFTVKNGEMHHQQRYKRDFRLKVVFLWQWHNRQGKGNRAKIGKGKCSQSLLYRGICHLSGFHSRNGGTENMKIALINGSPKRKDSASGLILKELQGLIPSENEIIKPSLYKKTARQQ